MDVPQGVRKRAVQLVVTGGIMAVAMFLPAGRLGWWQAIAVLAIYAGDIAFNALVVLRRNPELIAERAESLKHTKGWDKPVTGAVTVASLLVLVVAGLDVRFAWSSVPVVASVAGLLLVLAGSAVLSWAMSANRFFARVVRIQTERGHEVCDTGPYRIVRHPGYAGMIVYSLGMSVGLGSWWALIPSLLAAGGYVVRTALEDRTLQAELGGYVEYTSRVRYRLLPAVW